MANIDTYPPDYSTPIGQVRALCNDTETPYIFSDAQLQAYLAMYKNNIKRAAAQALYTAAADAILTLKYVRTDDLTVDGQKVSSELRFLADRLDADGKADDALDDEFFSLTYVDNRLCRSEYAEAWGW